MTLTTIKGYGGCVVCDMPGCEKRLATQRTSDDAELRASLGHEGWVTLDDGGAAHFCPVHKPRFEDVIRLVEAAEVFGKMPRPVVVDSELCEIATRSHEEKLDRVQRLIAEECDAVKEMLLAKNAAYGNSALRPLRVFSKADTVEQIKVRLDDKLSRLSRGSAAGEDPEFDIIGYLVLLRVHRRMAE